MMWCAFYLFALALLVLLGGWISRMCGGAPPKLPLGLDQWLYALPYGLIALPFAWYWPILSYAGAFTGKRTGHGGGIDLGTVDKDRGTEKLEYLIVWLRGRMSEYWYVVLIMTITGLAVPLVAAAGFAVVGEFLAALVLLIGGVLKAPAYMIGWAIYPNGSDVDSTDSELDEATEIGEFLTGVFGWGSVAIVFVMMILKGV